MKLKHLYILIIIVIFSGCAAKKSTIEYKERIIKDTVFKNVKETIIERFTDTLTIQNPCDSLGNLKPFTRSIKVDQGKINLTGLNNTITAKIDLEGYKKVWEKEFKSNYIRKVDTKEVEIVRYKFPFWLVLVFAISVLINIALLR
jgi:PBP1b-binding outer membrane lipoprotein LpoB